MLTIRLSRVGRKNDPSFRVIVVDSKKKVKTGQYLEMVGSYDPRADRIELKAERIKHWLSNGATTSDTVHNLLVSQKILDAKKINILPKYKAPEVAPAQEQAASTPQRDAEGGSEKEEAPAADAGGDSAVVAEAPEA